MENASHKFEYRFKVKYIDPNYSKYQNGYVIDILNRSSEVVCIIVDELTKKIKVINATSCICLDNIEENKNNVK